MGESDETQDFKSISRSCPCIRGYSTSRTVFRTLLYLFTISSKLATICRRGSTDLSRTDLVPIPPDLSRTVGHSSETYPQAGRNANWQQFYLGIKIDCNQFGFWISPDERLESLKRDLQPQGNSALRELSNTTEDGNTEGWIGVLGWRLNHFPGQPVPMLDNPLGEEKFPNIQSKPPLAQLEAISSCPITCYLGEETDPHLSTTSFQAVVESDKVSPQPPFLQAKQSQLPQPLLIRLLLQTLPQLRCPSLHPLQYLNIPLVVGGPKLNTVFEVRPHQCRVQGHNHFPSPAGHAIFDTSQDAIGFLGHLGTLLAHIQAAVNKHPQVLLCQAAFQPLFPKPVALHGVAVAQVQDLALGLVKPHTIDLAYHVPPTKLPLCLDVPRVDQPRMVQGTVEHADEDRVFVSSICSDYGALQKAPKHVQQLRSEGTRQTNLEGVLQVRGIIESLDENGAQPSVDVFYFLLEIKGVLLKLLREGKTASREAARWHQEGGGIWSKQLSSKILPGSTGDMPPSADMYWQLQEAKPMPPITTPGRSQHPKEGHTSPVSHHQPSHPSPQHSPF
ncbi:hypothetical protein QYF61_014929 [Mycteria americana]|uniref:Uncharacterized protein n=1 Tax=Mycteria americana TaxID=33587 RepID=A0AAN7NHY5_MYCAM|nr:hypothetical protein QYF61_014929 [Mycteria americana]